MKMVRTMALFLALFFFDGPTDLTDAVDVADARAGVVAASLVNMSAVSPFCIVSTRSQTWVSATARLK